MKTEADPPSALPLEPDTSSSGRLLFLRYWAPVLLWALLIFCFSTNLGSPRNTSRLLVPLLRWLNPNVSNETINTVQHLVRKTAHFTEYAVFAWLIWRVRRRPRREDPRPWRWSEGAFALGLTVLFAASDEWHQSFVASRDARVTDVLIDSVGAVAGLAAVCFWRRWRSRG